MAPETSPLREEAKIVVPTADLLGAMYLVAAALFYVLLTRTAKLDPYC